MGGEMDMGDGTQSSRAGSWGRAPSPPRPGVPAAPPFLPAVHGGQGLAGGRCPWRGQSRGGSACPRPAIREEEEEEEDAPGTGPERRGQPIPGERVSGDMARGGRGQGGSGSFALGNLSPRPWLSSLHPPMRLPHPWVLEKGLLVPASPSAGRCRL